jgi:hypothetical protein
MILKPDCRHFPGDRPCRFNKESGQMCAGCPQYATAGTRILIIKLAALGDVLRTTVILPGIKAEFPDSTITWLTAPGALELLKGNPLIDELWALDAEAALRLTVREFDVVFSPDADPHAATLAAAVRAKEKRGMVLHPRGHVVPATPEAETWFEMGAFDQLKQANQRTYQELIYHTLKLRYARQEVSLALNASESAWATDFLARQAEERRSADGSPASFPSPIRRRHECRRSARRLEPWRGRALEEEAMEGAPLRELRAVVAGTDRSAPPAHRRPPGGGAARGTSGTIAGGRVVFGPRPVAARDGGVDRTVRRHRHR